MKKYKTLLTALILCMLCAFALGIAACSGANGADGADGKDGTNGTNGTNGVDGQSAYELYVATYGYTGTLEEWLLSLQGEDGKSAYELYVDAYDYEGTIEEWLLTLQGEDGKSAYELYVDTYGYKGTEAQWLLDIANGTLSTTSYTVTFNSEGAGDIESQKVTKGDKATEPETPTLAGHTFLGWYVGEEKWSFIGYTVTENITLTAKWAVTNTDITYTLNNETETYEVTAYNGTDEVIDILPTVDGIAVTGIADNVFKSNTHIKSVTIHEGLTSIGASAFNSCSNLVEITLPLSLTTIGSTAFADSAIENVYYAGTATQWASINFVNNSANPLNNGAALYLNGSTTTAATEITISGITEISAYAFRGCTSIISVTLGNDVITIGESAFQNCYALRSMTLGSGVTTIGSNAFASCWRMTEVNNYSSLSLTAGESGNGSITFYTIVPVHTSTINSRGSFVTEGDYVFYAYTSGDTTTYYLAYYIGTDTDITLPDTIYGQTYTINTFALANNTTITSIVIPDTVTELSTGVLYGCSSVTYIVIGSGVTSIAASNTTGMSNLTTIYYNGTIENKANITIDSNSTKISNATWYYYSEEQPTDTENNYWHYVEGVITVWVVETTSGGTE